MSLYTIEVTTINGKNVSLSKYREKVDVSGEHAHPLFQYLCEHKKGLLGKSIKWNFTKFLIDSKGNVVERFAPTTSPLKIEQKIIELLA